MSPINIHITLSRSKYASNIGAAARACANLGATSLSLIQPTVDPFEEKSRKAAAGANDQLDKLILFNSKHDYISKNSDKIIIGMSRRGGRLRSSQDLKTTLKHLAQDHHEALCTGGLQLVFGPEDHGLDSSEIEMCHYVCKLPKISDFQSFNLAQAVLLTLFIAQDSINLFYTKEHAKTKEQDTLIQFEEIEYLLKKWLLSLGMNLNSKRINSYEVLKRMIKKAVPSQREIRLFEKVLQQTIRQLNDKK